MADIVIIGGGPAGLSAAVNAAAEGLDTVLIGETLGGQAGSSSWIENYAGFPQGVSGPDLTKLFCEQAKKFGAKLVTDAVESVCFADGDTPFAIRLCQGGNIMARAVLVASGSSYNQLPIMAPYEGKGVHYACNQQTVPKDCQRGLIIGGGNSAGQAAMFLSGRVQEVHFLVRDETLEGAMSAYLLDRINNADNINIHYECEVTDVKLSGGRIAGVVVNTGEDITVSDVYVMIGSTPNTDYLSGLVEIDCDGFITTTDNFRTSKDGMYAVGDCRAKSIKRVANAVGEGAASIAHIFSYLNQED